MNYDSTNLVVVKLPIGDILQQYCSIQESEFSSRIVTISDIYSVDHPEVDPGLGGID
ncbi:hypothetical protein HSRCO_1270 [Halanaeroarchaeum sp. HSR-CO]|nr:hypothetical protein HSRCO_1270 [Halanaeroarchaeum sp. HSR-CO]